MTLKPVHIAIILVLAAVVVATEYALYIKTHEVQQTTAPPAATAPAKPLATPKPAFAFSVVSMGSLEPGLTQQCQSATVELSNQMQDDAHGTVVIASFKTGAANLNVNGQPELRESIGTLSAGKSVRKTINFCIASTDVLRIRNNNGEVNFYVRVSSAENEQVMEPLTWKVM